jgi:hypothetical protein
MKVGHMKYALALALALAFALGLALDVAADEKTPAKAPGTDPPPLGTTADWLELQRSGAQEGGPNPVPGEAAERIYKRYLNTFDQPVPATFQSRGGKGQR